jgi:hypothetical protein
MSFSLGGASGQVMDGGGIVQLLEERRGVAFGSEPVKKSDEAWGEVKNKRLA